MKIDINKLYVVHKPTEHSEKADVFGGRPYSLEDLFSQVRGGLMADMVHGIYTTEEEAEKEAKMILGFKQNEETRFRKFTQELGKLSSKYGIAIHSTGGVYFFDKPLQITYRDDHTSGDLDVSWDENEA